MPNYTQGFYTVINKKKYIGSKQPYYRSSWEQQVMYKFDIHPYVEKWGSEVIKIGYYNPFTKKNTVYVPDFFVMFSDKTGKKHNMLIEIKPLKEIYEEHAKNKKGIISKKNAAVLMLNKIKWDAALKWCKAYHCEFKILSEKDLFF